MLCLGRKAGVATAMNAAMRSEMTAATPAAGRRMLAEVYQRNGKRQLASGALACGFWGSFSHR
ncbi:MAG: hypothetical protein R2788_11875 [Saprospiraceae bacterium]